MTLEEILKQGILQKATDIHLCPKHNQTQVLFRVAGKLTQFTQQSTANNLINRLKMLSELDLSETRRCQEGQFEIRLFDAKFFIRTSIVNTSLGEKAALRILPEKFDFTLETLHIPSEIKQPLYQALNKCHGLVIVCGATGAGKTTTLYSCLEHINTGDKSIFTIEDPIEFNIDDFFQCEPNKAINLDSATLLKGFLRQDPDVIFVGELRDAQTANLAITAALTGHLVLTTLHSNSALDAIHRLRSWQVDFFSLASSLNFVLHQKMLYEDGQRTPWFSSICPAWTHTLPSNYDVLFQDYSQWHLWP